MEETMIKRCITITGTPGLKKLIIDSQGRNRGPVDTLDSELDPYGVHVCQMIIPHNDIEWRALWLVKVKDQDEPVTLWMDNSFAAYTRWTAPYEPDEGAVA